jgi:Flp pilus assembly protein TadD
MPGDDVRYVAKRDVNLGKVFLEKKSWEKALESARKAQERDPTFAAAHTLAGQALAGLGQCKEALAEGRKACGR